MKRPFPTYEGEVLCWDAGAHFTLADEQEKDGYPRTKTVLRALKHYRPDQFKKERHDALKASFSKLWPAAKRYWKIIKEIEEEPCDTDTPPPSLIDMPCAM